MEILTLTLTDMAHGGAAVARDTRNRVIFVPFALPGEQVRVRVMEDKGRYAHAKLLEVLQPAPERVEPRCIHFGPCGGCHYQHAGYGAQLGYKTAIIRDQLERIGRLKQPNVKAILPNPEPWYYGMETNLNPAPEGGLGYWSPSQRQVMPISECHIIHESLPALLHDVDLDLPGLRKLRLRVGDDGALLAALETEDAEPPDLETDVPLSIALILPDETAVTLIGDHYVVQSVKGHDFRVSAGCFFHPSPAAAQLLVDTTLTYAAIAGGQTVIDAYSGVGMLTAFLATAAAEVIAIEQNPDAVADAAVNLIDTENISLYQGTVEETLPALELTPDVLVFDPPATGVSAAAMKAILAKQAPRLVYISSDAATLARDGRQLAGHGYHLVEIQPIDMFPQTYRIQTVSLWLQR
jgi:23S rRNA (uracil1939-C5)-methyltransferase